MGAFVRAMGRCCYGKGSSHMVNLTVRLARHGIYDGIPLAGRRSYGL